MKLLVLKEKILCDLECILNGYFSPLNTFMNKKDWENVCLNMHLDNGSFFPLPVTLEVDKYMFNLGETIQLVDDTNYLLAELEITDMYEPDIDWECKHAYGTIDTNHPYVKYKQLHKNMLYISGPLTKINNVRHYDFIENRMTPDESRLYFKQMNWKTIVGFQTRNPMHRAHFELTKNALLRAGPDAKLFLNPVVGETQSVDIDYHVRVACYKNILPKYNEGECVLNLLPLSMRMAGPREACFHALIRKNCGCTHFIVGRDHAGPSYKTVNNENFYGPYDAQELFFKYADEIGIKPIVSQMIVFNSTRKIYQPIDEVPCGDKVVNLSGTEVRNKLTNGEDLPEWFSFPEVSKILQKSVKKRGCCYYLIGLSGSGKTTYANILRTKLLEKDPSIEITMLDGDIVRHNISKGLGFSIEDRKTNIRRIGYVASEIVKHGGTVIVANIAPFDDDRLHNRDLIEQLGGKYIEIFVNIPIEKCEQRDVKGLYKKAREGKIPEFTGISSPFDDPTKADIVITDENYTFDEFLK